MRIVCWNVRGLGSSKKKEKVKNFLEEQKADVIILSESKLNRIDSYTIRRIWGSNDLGFHYLPSVGSRGGILIMWLRSTCSVSLPRNGIFTCSVMLKGRNDPCAWFLTGVYGPVEDDLHEDFMQELLALRDYAKCPWLVIGDFNLKRFSTDKKGGCSISSHMRRFNWTLATTKLIELPLHGAKFTWVSAANSTVRSRIDRAFVDEAWETMFSLAHLSALPKPVSDHKPLLLQFGSQNKGPIPFKFCRWWLDEEGALELVKEWWTTPLIEGTPGFILWKKLSLLKQQFKAWRRRVDGARKVRSKEVLNRLNELDLIGDEFIMTDLQLMEKESLELEWGRLALIEEQEVRLKSRVLWLTAGDANTAFFHRVVKGRRRRNSINKLSIGGTEFTAPISIREEASNYFESFYLESHKVRSFPHDLIFPRLSDVEKDLCEADFSETEVLLAVKQAKGEKAPGPDGFSMDFYKVCWPIVKEEVIAFIREIQERFFIDWRMNNAFIALLPKKESALDIREFRPISLINCGYKIFSKILASRLKMVLNSLINPVQGAFLPKRQILDGVLIAAECIDDRLKSGTPGLLCKLDIEKAFDCVNWAFLQLVMHKMGFGSKFRRWIEVSLKSGRFSVLINGQPGKLFATQRGVRQGDPASPYLFLLAMEVLSLMIASAVNHGWLHGFHPGEGNIIISHLQFADDTMVFLDATNSDVCMLKNILRCFELASGLRINFGKSSLIPIGSCPNLPQFASILSCKEASLPLVYLGLPLGARFKALSIWTPFVEKMENRLASWRKNSLSKGGKLVLIKSCLLSIPTYFLSIFPIPVSIAQRMERLIRNFLWGGSAARRAFCLVNWNKCTTPKAVGGLGIRSFLRMNNALCSKWIWRYIKEKHALWREVVQARHGSEKGNIFPKPPRNSHGVGVWKNICRQISFVQECSSFVIGDGRFARFWIDKWCSSRPLQFLAPNLFRIVKRKQALVSEVVKLRNGQYQIHLNFYHPVEDVFIHEVPIVHNAVFANPLVVSRDDEVVWGLDNDDNDGYSVSAAYDLLLQPVLLDLEEFPAECVWKANIPLKIQFFVWLAALNRIATYDLLRRRGIIWVSRCSLCCCTLETANHLLIHCGFASIIWSSILNSFGVTWVQPASVQGLLTSWQYYKGSGKGKMLWSLVPHAVLWCIWLERNARCYDGEDNVSMKVLLSVRGMLGHWCSAIPVFKDHPLESFLFRFDRISNLNL